ncbi:MAG: ubiE 3 [Cyanobacteria bacterium RYN_339]|nr:ubiE 3 [Cyanobacteria bacterium RYN_339]
MIEKFRYEDRHLLDDAWRHRHLDPAAFWARAGLRAGQTVVDVGAGTGYFAVPAARRVGRRGHVYACDVSPEMVAHVAQEATRGRLGQLEALRSGEHALPLPDAVADVALAAFVLHEVNDPYRLLAELARVLKPTGRLLVLDWSPEAQEPENLPRRMRWAPATVRYMLGQAGLEPVDEARPNDANYLVSAKPSRS